MVPRAVAPRLHRGAPSAEITFDDVRRDCSCSATRASVSERTMETLRERLAPSRATFGDWKLIRA